MLRTSINSKHRTGKTDVAAKAIFILYAGPLRTSWLEVAGLQFRDLMESHFVACHIPPFTLYCDASLLRILID